VLLLGVAVGVLSPLLLCKLSPLGGVCEQLLSLYLL
jgi:hypothetical protein